MKKKLFPILLSFIVVNSFSQASLPNSFQIGDYVEVFHKDSLKIYFNCTGTVVDKKCAAYYRVGKMDSSIINIKGDFADYDMNGNIFFKATMLNNKLEGVGRYYYPNGNLKEQGNYNNDIRDGKWIYYYSNGQVEKIYNYVKGEPFVVEAYTRKGKIKVVSGNGNFKTEFSKYKQCNFFEAWGKVLNGKKNGKWTFSNPNARLPIATEIYEEGRFIKGVSGNEKYSENPAIDLTKFYANENLSLLDNLLGCPGERGIFFTKYRNSDLNSIFYPELQEHLNKYKLSPKNQWLIVGIKVDKNDKASEINIFSSIDDDRIERYTYDKLLEMGDWTAAKVNSVKIESTIFFTILVSDGQIIIPVYYFSTLNKN